jgi:hypothetical protein
VLQTLQLKYRRRKEANIPSVLERELGNGDMRKVWVELKDPADFGSVRPWIPATMQAVGAFIEAKVFCYVDMQLSQESHRRQREYATLV